MPFSVSVILAAVAFALGIGGTAWIALKLRRKPLRQERLEIQTVIERVRAVGKLVGLEVCAKEIATATSGWAWLPPILLSQARLAMIFNFEKQYSVDLSCIGHEHIRDAGGGRFVVSLPPIRGSLRLIDVTPYDIQGAKVLGLVDLVSMTADRQKDLMRKAQQQAAALYESSDERYLEQARRSIERHMVSLMELFGVRLEVAWRTATRVPEPVRIDPAAVHQVPALAIAS